MSNFIKGTVVGTNTAVCLAVTKIYARILCKLILPLSLQFARVQKSALLLFRLCGVWQVEALEEASVFHLRGGFTTVFVKL